MKNRLRILRKEKGLTQLELANYLKTSKANVSRWELGEHEMSYDTLNELSNFFNTTIDYLLGLSDIRNPEKEIEKSKSNKSDNPILVALYDEINELDDEMKTEILDIVKKIKKMNKK